MHALTLLGDVVGVPRTPPGKGTPYGGGPKIFSHKRSESQSGQM